MSVLSCQTDSQANRKSFSLWASAFPMALVPIAQVVTSSPYTSDLNALSPIGDCQEVKSGFSTYQQTRGIKPLFLSVWLHGHVERNG